MERLNTIKELINQGNVEQAIQQLDEILQTDFPGKDEAYYLRGKPIGNKATGNKH